MLKHQLLCFNVVNVFVLQYELATGRFPYPKWNSVFDQLTQVVKGDPPHLSNSEERQFSPKFIQFVNLWCVHMWLSCFPVLWRRWGLKKHVSLLSSLCLIMCVPALQRTSQKGQSTENCWYVKPVFVWTTAFELIDVTWKEFNSKCMSDLYSSIFMVLLVIIFRDGILGEYDIVYWSILDI